MVELAEGLVGGLDGWVLVQGDEAVLVLGKDSVTGRDRLVEGVGEFLLFGGLHNEQADVDASLVDVADAVVAPSFQGELVEEPS